LNYQHNKFRIFILAFLLGFACRDKVMPGVTVTPQFPANALYGKSSIAVKTTSAYSNKEEIFLSNGWFEKNQRILLWLLNSRFTKRWFRRMLDIKGCDLSFEKKINCILPNSFCYDAVIKGNKVEKITAEFRITNQFAYCLYWQFRPLWQVLHAWDSLVADKWLPAMSFGLNSFGPSYPDYSSPGTTTCNGYVSTSATEDGTTWTDAHGETSDFVSYNAVVANSTIYVMIWSNSDGGYNGIARSYMGWDIHTMGAGAAISAATVSLWGSSNFDLLQAHPALGIYASTQASNTTLSATQTGFNACGTTLYAPQIGVASIVTGAYNAFALNATGLSAMSSALSGGGIFNICAREANYDAPDIDPGLGGNGNQIGFYLAGAFSSSTTQSPKLVVTYTPGGGSFKPILMMY